MNVLAALIVVLLLAWLGAAVAGVPGAIIALVVSAAVLSRQGERATD